MTLTALLLTAGSAQAGSAAALDRIAPVEVSVPESSRAEIPEHIPITGPWRVVYSAAGVRTWEAPLPIRPRSLFFHRAPGDMAVYVGERKLRHSNTVGGDAGSWRFTSHALQVRRPVSAGAPKPGEYTMRYSTSTQREASLNFARAGMSPERFVRRSLQVEDTTRHGLFLPAPAQVAFDVTIPEGGVLDVKPALIPPEASDPAAASDGASLVVAIGETAVATIRIEPGEQLPREALRIDLSQWAGQDVRLTLSTTPDGTTDLDYVFVADPVIHTPVAAPPRVVVIFLDTLRADHIGTYGYDRDTTPKLDAWADGGVVFEQARSIAPWTLPSTRTMVTGRIPEKWGSIPTIQDRLAEAGWATTFLVGNIYLSSNFEMADGWGEHRCVNWPLASVQVDRALSYLDSHADRPVLMFLHFMDMHLPYTEPPTYRYTFAGEAPESLPQYQFHRSQVLRAARKMGEEGKQYVRDRYDNNLRYIDDELARFLATLDEDDTVIVLADHGEEFWDHDDFEHGHTLYDELLHIPMIARGPGFPAGRFSEPVSMLDVAPTLAAAAGVPADDMTGWPLQDFADRRGDFAGRPQAFGRPLYGSDIWGSLRGGEKYITREGREEVYDVLADPTEQDNLAGTRDTQGGRGALAEALDTEVHAGYRLTAKRANKGSDVVARVVVPGGFVGAWPAADPTQGSRSEVDGGMEWRELTWLGNTKKTGEIFVVPREPLQTVTEQVELYIQHDSSLSKAPFPRRGIPPFEAGRSILTASGGGHKVTMGYAVVPLPRPDWIALNAVNEENCASLQALGYVENCDEFSQ